MKDIREHGKTGLTILMPCLNEEQTIEICIKKALGFLERYKINGEVLIADNGSTDSSTEIAEKCGARVIEIQERGYGAALYGGILAAEYEYIIMGDADDSYDFSNLDQFVEKLNDGYDLVMGNRFKGGIEKGAMSFSHQYIGNPVLSGIGRLFYGIPIGYFHCGLRGFKRDSIISLNLRTPGMEFASEMVVKASLQELRICEVPCKLHIDGRNRPPHLRSIPDGLRHLRFLLIYSPKWLFFYPGIFMFVLGLITTVLIFIKPIYISGIHFEIATMFYSAMLMLMGMQLLQFSLYTNIIGMRTGQLPSSPKIVEIMKRFMYGWGGVASAILFLLFGAIGVILSIIIWSRASFGPLNDTNVHRLAILSGSVFVLGMQLLVSFFFVNVLNMGDSI